MQQPAPSPARDTSGLFGHPRGLTNLFFTELWERFGYYGMRALLTLFMVAPLAKGGLGFDNRTAGIIYGTYTMSVYMLSIPGGYIADNFLGARATVFWGGVIIAAGYLSLAVHSTTFFYLGLVLVACGTGLLKPNISTMVGSLYAKDDPRRDSGFSIFYMGINTGALVAPLITGWVAQSDMAKEFFARNGFDPNRSWHWAFAVSGIGMIVGLVTYVLQRHRLADVGHAPAASVPRPWGKLFAVLVASAAVFGVVTLSDFNPSFAWISYGYVVVPVLAIIWFGTRRDPAQRRMAAVFVFALAYLIFCAIFEQAGSTISLFADQLTRTEIAGFAFPSSWFQSVNSIFVIVLSPVFAFVWVKWGDRIPSPIKFSFGLFFLALSFVLMVPAAKLTIDGRISPMWLVGLFFLQTVGELALSPVGLSTMTKLAPANLVGLVMGVWFLAAALGNKLAGTVAGDFNSTDPNALSAFFLHQAGWVGLAFIALLALTPWVKKLMGEVK
ncbi:peptide MFS transporter [Oleiharenicola sp. Vm1]|uniref:peptide MFS transporter n=1 Tax=Oleiharenicola sp. Vm1 TaxID=3398393 RepID=UPI0039F4A7B4